MKFFIDTADVEAIAALAATGMVDGVTTNPSLVAKSGHDFKTLIGDICALVAGPVSAEVTALEADAMLEEADELLGNCQKCLYQSAADMGRAARHAQFGR